MERAFVVLGAIFGVAGTAAAAAANHITGPGSGLDTAANFLLFHAPALIGIALLVKTGTVHANIGRFGGLLVLVGVALFSGQLALRALADATLFPMAAPAGGTTLMIGWLLVGLAALVGPRRV